LDDSLFTTIAVCLVRVLRGRIRTDDVRLEARLMEDLGVDSVRLMELKNELEESLAIPDIPVQDLFDVALARGVPMTVQGIFELCQGLQAMPGALARG
jgi:acyl carrier protein